MLGEALLMLNSVLKSLAYATSCLPRRALTANQLSHHGIAPGPRPLRVARGQP